jgi:starch-binding outer membrane protein, SusD/RagB family
MKTKIFFLAYLMVILLSCNENELLKEVPLDFLSTENAYVTEADFELAINRLYYQARFIYEIGEGGSQTHATITTDLGYRPAALPDAHPNSPKNALFPTSPDVLMWWRNLYQMVYNSNVIIGRIEGENTVFNSEQNRKVILAEAHFFRALAYRTLAGLFGGVPIVVEELTEPKRDFIRSTRSETWQQSVEDLKIAVQFLPDADNVKAPGRLCDAAANHLLAEVYVSIADWDKAIEAASKVINSGKFSLMRNRFGSLANKPGDVWWDLFRVDNQNRTAGNKEGIWVLQNESKRNITGSASKTSEESLETRVIPRYWALTGPDNKSLFIGPTTQNMGRGAGQIQPHRYTEYTIWESDWANDMRNSEYNIRRDLVADNPQSAYFGKKIIENKLVRSSHYQRNWYAMFAKASTEYQHPDYLIIDPATGLVSNDAGELTRDKYAMRLPETYLLRAEAYLGKGDKVNAAADINFIRQRVNAKPVSPADVNIDYILDERARELLWEEVRVLTLSRLGLNYDRKKKYDLRSGDQISPHHNLFPIPFSEIERNTGAVLEQNPGY